MRKLGYRPALDGVRGIAVLLVVVTHTSGYVHGLNWTRGGVLGVDVFFVLSGFLITSLLLGEFGRAGAVSLRAFYGRRARRLLPALFAIVGLAAAATIIVSPGRAPGALLTAVLRATYLTNFLHVAGVNPGNFGHLWSLAEEEQFYLVWPLILVGLMRRGGRARHLLIVLGGVAAALSLHRVQVIHSGGGLERVWYAPDTHADPLLFGCAAGVAWSYGLLRVPKAIGAIAALTAAGVVLVFRGDDVWAYPFALPLFAAAVSLVMIALLDHPTWSLSRVLAARPLRFTGKISYGLYLWHVPMLALFGIAGLPLALAATLVSYRFLELPIQRRCFRANLAAIGLVRTRAASASSGGAAPVPLESG